MADGVLFGIVSEILKDLGSAAIKEIGKIWGVKQELVKLEGTMSSIKAVLRDAEKKSTTSHQVKDWLEKLENVVYDADDLVDEVRTRALMQKNDKLSGKVITFFSSSNPIAFKLSMSQRIKEIRKMLEQIKADKDFYLLERLPDEIPVSTKSRETHSFVPDDEVIGRDKDKKNIIQLLLDHGFEENVSVIPIIGMGGLGKTTLAQHVFNDAEVTSKFELKFWVCVSDPFDLKIILEKMVESCDARSIDQLQNKLRETIDGKRYLLVLDDVWTQDRNEWNELRNLLMGGARGSKILVTARSNVVAEITRTDGVEPYRLTALTEENSWSLFKKMAFKQGKKPLCSDIILEIGMEIVDKCRGSPLAIKTIGSLLCTKSTEAEWLAFKDTELVNISKEGGDILATLKLSYNHLPSHLKHCFAYCSLFPKDDLMNVQWLIQQWMAQGYVVSSGNQQCLEDVGYGYFMELFGRSFFQEVKKDDNGLVSFCKMHDLMHDLASSVARSCFLYTKQENCPYGEVRHLTNYFESNMSLLQEKKLRTLLISCNISISKSPSTCATIMSNCKLLRALDLSRMFFETLPSGLGDLIHLRYLNLSRNWMKELPKSIIRLHNLQTLILSECHKLLCLPTDITGLLNLRHLDTRSCSSLTYLPSGLGDLIHLRYLDLSDNNMKELPKSITRLHNLQTLILCGCNELLCLPRDMTGLLNLRHLDARYCRKLKYLPSGIGQLTSLQTLGLFPVPNDSMALSGYVAGLNELKYLNNLKGCLEIEIMGHGKHALAGCETSNFKEINLWSLCVYWSKNYDTVESKEDYKRKLDMDMAENDEAILDFLQPNPIMKEFFLHGYMGARISPWISSLSNLVKLCIQYCRNLESIPCLDQLHGLKEFRLVNLPKLEFISNKDDDTFSPTTLPLVKMNATDGKDECNGSNYSSEKTLHLHPPFFPSLTQLHIRKCPKLTSMPLFPYVEDLSLGNCNLQLFKQSVAMMSDTTNPALNVKCAGSSLLNSYFPKLKHLEIEELDVYLYFLEFMCNHPSLQSLTLSSLKLYSLPPEIGNLKSLESLGIFNCYNLASLPESVGNLSSLRSLALSGCIRLVELPEAIRRLKSLQSLSSSNSLSKEKYERNSGKEWHKIAHIRKVTVT